MKSRRVFLAALVVALLPSAPAHAYAPEPPYSNLLTNPEAHDGEIIGGIDTDRLVGTRGWRSSTFMVGDSVTAYAIGFGFKPSGWEMSSVPGRNIVALPHYIADRVAAQRRLPRPHHSKRWKRHHPRLAARAAVPRFRYPTKRAVIALGSNATPGWTSSDLRRAVNLLPTSTVVVFVTPYRDLTVWPDASPYRARASVVRAYAVWERRIAKIRPHTCVAEWAGYAARYPSLVSEDGVHPTERGSRAWAKIVKAVTDRCA